MPRTKIVCTLGPASSNPVTLREMVQAGMDVARIKGRDSHLGDVGEATYDSLCLFGREAVIAAGTGKPGVSVVVTAGYPFHTAGSTNTMRVERL